MPSNCLRPCCQRALASGKSQCPECGTALSPGREPTPQERYATSEEAREARYGQIMVARFESEPDQVDQRLLNIIRAGAPVGQRFTWADDLLRVSGMSSCALKHSLTRLVARKALRVDGAVRLRPSRFRPVFELLPPPDDRPRPAP
jgi:hypothetical protein